MDVAIIGAAGACGRQLAVQLLESTTLHHSSRLELVGHHGGASENELWGLRSDLEDAFIDHAPVIEVLLDPGAIKADIVVMLAGRTLSTDPRASADRIQLGRANARIFSEYAQQLADRPGEPPIVIVQSHPVELGVRLFSEALGRHRVLGAGAWSDTLRFRQELARDLQVRRPAVTAPMLGQHGDHLVPAWSHVHARGVPADALAREIARMRADRSVIDLPGEVVRLRAQVLAMVKDEQIAQAYELVTGLAPDLRAAIKPFFTHFTAGHTTEVVTARAVADVIAAIVDGHRRVMPIQVHLKGEWMGVEGVIGAPVIVGPEGWREVLDMQLAGDEAEALHRAADAIAVSCAAILADGQATT